MSDEESPERGENEFEEEEVDNDSEEEKRKENLAKLNVYLNEMVYKVHSKEIVTCCRTKRLTKRARSALIIDMYDEYGPVLQPKERARRIYDEILHSKVLTAEELEVNLQKDAANEQKKLKAQRKLNRKRMAVLLKCEKACTENILNKIINTFAKFIADRAHNYHPPSVETENFQKMQQTLMCNLYMTLGENKKKISPDQKTAKTVTMILADLIMQVLFLTQNSHKYADIPNPTKLDPDLHEEACEALAKERLNLTRQKQEDALKMRYYMKCATD